VDFCVANSCILYLSLFLSGLPSSLAAILVDVSHSHYCVFSSLMFGYQWFFGRSKGFKNSFIYHSILFALNI